jgi:hypothetical protein
MNFPVLLKTSILFKVEINTSFSEAIILPIYVGLNTLSSVSSNSMAVISSAISDKGNELF